MVRWWRPVRDPDLIPAPDLLRSRTEEHQNSLERYLFGQVVALRHQDFSVAFAIYQHSERDFLRSLFGRSLTFVLLNVPEDLLAERIKTRKGTSLTQYINAFHPVRTVDQVLEVWKSRCPGFEPKQDGEPNTFQVDVARAMSKDDVARKAAALLDSIFHVLAPCESVLSCVEPLTLEKFLRDASSQRDRDVRAFQDAVSTTSLGQGPPVGGEGHQLPELTDELGAEDFEFPTLAGPELDGVDVSV